MGYPAGPRWASSSAFILPSEAHVAPAPAALGATLQPFSETRRAFTKERAVGASVHSQNTAFPKEPTGQETEGAGQGKNPKATWFSPTHKRANTEPSPPIPHRDQPHSHFYLKTGSNVRITGEFLEIKHPQRKKKQTKTKTINPTAFAKQSGPAGGTSPARVSLLWGISPCSSFSFSSYDSGTRF